MLRVVQFEIPGQGRRVGVVRDGFVYDVTSLRSEWHRVVDVVASAWRAGVSLAETLASAADRPECATRSYAELLEAKPHGAEAFLHPPADQADPRAVLITGTGLTHLGGMKSRDQMHGGAAAMAEKPPEPQTDSAKMFALGIAGGKPGGDERGNAPEWFYKGNGTNLRGPNAEIELPAFALDGGEEPEFAGIYLINDVGIPFRLGFVLANEWSDHATEKINYLYLAPSKLRTCAIGPELLVGFDFRKASLKCTVRRNGGTIYESGELFSGEEAMCHSLANCEDHHFKYPQHRQPGDLHVHFFGTSKLSYSTRNWKYQAGDVVTIEAPGLCGPLVNRVVAGDAALSKPVRVRQA